MAQLRVGQRVLVTGTVARYLDVEKGETVPLAVTATYADIVGSWFDGSYDCRLLRAGGAAVDARVRAADITVVRGKPFVQGHDERRGRGPAARTASTATATPAAVTESASDTDEHHTHTTGDTVTRTAPAAPIDANERERALLDILRGAGLTAEQVRAIAEDVTATSLQPLGETVATLADSLHTALDILDTATPATKRAVRAALGLPAATGSPIADALADWYTAGVPSAGNLLLASPPSLGKSYAVRKFAAGYDVYLEHNCSNDMDEVATMLGSVLPDGHGGWTGIDGVLTQAVRAASDEKTVLLFLDEVLRLGQTPMEFLLAFLVPRDGRYYLRTRRVGADGNLEVVSCAIENLHIVGATNLGIAPIIEAFWSRWETVRFEFTPAVAASVAAAVLAAQGVTDTGNVLAQCVGNVIAESRRAMASGAVRFAVDIRTVERAAARSNGTAADTAQKIAERLTDNCAHWNADTGDTDPQSAKVCEPWAALLRAI